MAIQCPRVIRGPCLGNTEAYLYGSFASNQQDAASDIDVLVIGTPRGEVLAEAMRKIERQPGREVSYTVLTGKEMAHGAPAKMFSSKTSGTINAFRS